MPLNVIILVGLPGSGKSTFSQALINQRSDWCRVNQDDMGSRKACENSMRTCLKSNYNVIVDRCNFDVSQRETWLKIAKQYDASVYCVVLTASSDECSNRISYRVNHPTGVEGKNGIAILRRFMKNYQPPTSASPEGFQRLIYLSPSPATVCSQERVDRVLRDLGILEPVNPVVTPEEVSNNVAQIGIKRDQGEESKETDSSQDFKETNVNEKEPTETSGNQGEQVV